MKKLLTASAALVIAIATFTACGSSNTVDADENPVRTYQVPGGTVVCIWETQYWSTNAVAGGLSCDWDHVTPNPR